MPLSQVLRNGDASSSAVTGSRRVLRIADLARDPSSYVDPKGFVFHLDGEIYRYIRADAAPFFERLFEDGTLARLVGQSQLVPSALADLVIEDDPNGMVVHHEHIRPVSYCVEWCPGMLRAAGRLTLNLAHDLAGRDLMLQDAHPWNVLFRGTTPIFVDLTSISVADEKVIWPAHEQFEAYFLRPLILVGDGKGRVVRALLMNNIEGVGRSDFLSLISTGRRLRHPGVVLGDWAEGWLQRRPVVKERARRLAERATARATPAVRRRFLRRLRHRLESIRAPTAKHSWTHYYAEIPPGVDKNTKLNAVRGILDRLRPGTVLDLGCNIGVFSLEAARRGARVISLDTDDACVESLYVAARRDDLPITPLIANVLCPTPAYGFMGRQYPDLWSRARANTVLCLGLMHHLHLTGRTSLERIATMVDAVTEQHLIFEFVARDDPNIARLPERRRIDYDLDSVVGALRDHFRDIEVRPSDRPTRNLLLCSK